MQHEPQQGTATRTGAVARLNQEHLRNCRKQCHDDSMARYPNVLIKLELGPDLRLGPGKIALLEHIEQSGSISAAARAMNMSYRRAWLLIDELKNILGTPAVVTSAGGSGGGGARLTTEGKNLIQKFRELEAKARAAGADLQAMLKTQA